MFLRPSDKHAWSDLRAPPPNGKECLLTTLRRKRPNRKEGRIPALGCRTAARWWTVIDDGHMRSAIGIPLIAVGMLLCMVDLGRRVARRRQTGGRVQAVWAPEGAPVLFYVGAALLVGGSVLAFGTANP